MRNITSLFAVLLLAAACSGDGAMDMAKDDPAGAIYGHGMLSPVKVLVPGTTTTIP